MCTTHLLTISQHALGRGVYTSMHWAGEGVYPSMHWAGGCVPQHLLGRGCVCTGDVCLGVSSWGVSAQGVSAWGCVADILPRKRGRPPLWTDTCENQGQIYLFQFSVWDFSNESQTWGSLKTHYEYALAHYEYALAHYEYTLGRSDAYSYIC